MDMVVRSSIQIRSKSQCCKIPQIVQWHIHDSRFFYFIIEKFLKKCKTYYNIQSGSLSLNQKIVFCFGV